MNKKLTKQVCGQFCIETLHERRKRNREFSEVCLAYSNRKTKCQNYRKISRN